MYRLSEIGKTGLKWSYGYIYDEFLSQLRGTMGVKQYTEMANNDSILGACLFAIKQILREARWSIKKADDSPQAAEDAKFLESNMHGMKYSWPELIHEILSMIEYGWSWFEIVYKRDENGKIVWKKIAIRSQKSLARWEMAENGTILGMWQRPAPDYRSLYIPINKSLLFRTCLNSDNPEGYSVLRPAYRAWYFKKNIEEVEGIGVERDLAGLPVVTPPELFDMNADDDKTKAAISYAKKLIANIRRDEQDGVFLPPGWKLELLSSPGKRQFDTTEIINRYNKEMAVTVLAQFIMLGMERTGSYALAGEQTDMFYLCLEGWMHSIQSIFNRYGVPKLFALNGVNDRPLPFIVHSNIRKYKLKDLSTYVSTLSKEGLLDITDEIKDFLKNYARLQEFNEVKR